MSAGAGHAYYPHVDGLRAIAVLAVIVFHLWPHALPGGFAGVDVFFVISGYVVSASLLAHPARGFGAFLAGFYARRVRRIAPALVVCLLASGLASALLIPDAWLSANSERTGLLAFIGLSNVVLARSEGDYFAPRTEFNPYTQTWSLGVEEQFYLLFPLLFYGWLRGGDVRRVALGVTLLAAIASLATAWRWSATAPADAFYLLPARFWQLAAGVLLFQALTIREASTVARRHNPHLQVLGSGISLGLLVLGLWWARPGRTPWPDGLLPVLGTVGTLLCLHRRAATQAVGRMLGGRWVVALGRRSYSLYLWHWPVFVLFRWTVGLETAATQWSALASAFVLAFASYHLVERPLRYTRIGRSWHPALFVALAAALVVASGWGFRTLFKQRAALSLSVVARDAHDWSPGGAPYDPPRPDCTLQHASQRQGPELRWRWWRSGCAPETVSRRVFVLGDSHALAYAQMLQRHVLASGDEVRLWHRTGCGYPLLQGLPETAAMACRAATVGFLDEALTSARAGDVLFLPSLRLPRLSEQWQAGEGGPLADPQPASIEAASEAEALRELAPFAAGGMRIVFEAPKPVLPAPPYRCADRFNADNPACAGGTRSPRDAIEALRAPVLASFARLQAALPGASVWDPLPLLCDAAVCDAYRAGRPLFFDGDHLSGYGNRVLAPSFAAHLEGLRAGFPQADRH